MTSFKTTVLSTAALLGLSLAPSLKADQWNKKTVLTVKETIQLPNTVLQPGTYVFKLADSLSDRHIVQIFNADETKVIATILAIPNYRLKPTGSFSASEIDDATSAVRIALSCAAWHIHASWGSRVGSKGRRMKPN